MNLNEFRQQYPQYKDMSDQNLADQLYNKYYSDMPRAAFNQKIGFADGDSTQPSQNWEPSGQRMLENIPSSAWHVATDISSVVIHPIQTAENFYDLGKGVLQMTGALKGTEYEKYPQALGKFIVDRYGSIDAAKKTITDDPIGFAMDLSTVLSGGGTALERAPGIVGKAGEALRGAGETINPMTAAGHAAMAVGKPLGKGAAQFIGGLGTHTGAEPIITAAKAGFEGGPANEAFTSQFWGRASPTEPVADMRRAIAQMRKERGDLYTQSMQKIKADKTILTPLELDKAASDTANMVSFKGVVKSQAAADIRDQLVRIVENWKNQRASEFWTPEGVDQLKQSLGEVYAKTQPNTLERKVAGEFYDAARHTITTQAPEYAKVMQGYEDATELVNEIEKTLSAKPNASVDTSLRKLQSILRDNVNTSYSHRRELAKFLIKAGAPHLLEKLSGQALRSLPPRGLGRMAAGLEVAGAALSGHPAAMVSAVPILAVSSPRVVGEMAHGLGTAARLAKHVPGRTLFETGQLGNEPFADLIAPELP